MTRRILFLCPHGAAKSVLAAAYFQQLSDQQGLGFQASCAGTEPDATISPAVMELLRGEGIDVADRQPQKVTDAQLATAFRVVSLGCSVEELGEDQTKVEQWDDVPMVSMNVLAARDAIRAHVEQLVIQLQDA